MGLSSSLSAPERSVHRKRVFERAESTVLAILDVN